jgi:hypothetical protein
MTEMPESSETREESREKELPDLMKNRALRTNFRS